MKKDLLISMCIALTLAVVAVCGDVAEELSKKQQEEPCKSGKNVARFNVNEKSYVVCETDRKLVVKP